MQLVVPSIFIIHYTLYIHPQGAVLIDKVLNFVDEHNMLPESGLVLACVSGGADSMCLLEVFRRISTQRGFSLAVAHFNHKLRGEESDRDEKFVRDYCEKFALAYYTQSGDVCSFAKQNGLSIETAARDMRYDFFHNLADTLAAEKIATAHNADDNTETILINLARGAGTKGISGIPPIRGKIIRPMLTITRDEIIAFLSDHGISYVEDSTNSDDVYTRNKIRHHVIPILKEINPRLNEAASITARLMREDEKMLSEMADIFIKDKRDGFSVTCEDILALPTAVSRRVIRKLYGGNLSFKHVDLVLELCKNNNPSALLSLPKMTVYKDYGRIVFGLDEEFVQEGFEEFIPLDGSSVIIPAIGLKISCKAVSFDDKIGKVNKSLTSFLFKSIDTYGTMSVRPRRAGDKIKFLGQDGTKTLKKLFIERRIPAHKRSLIPVIADSKGVLAVYGLGRGERLVPQSGDIALRIDFEEI